MLYHRAYGRALDALAVAVVDNRKAMLSLMRGMLAAIGTGRIDTYESPTVAFDAMTKQIPDLVIAAATMQPLSGPALVRTMRHRLSGQLALVPAMIMSARARPALVEESLRAGAHQVLVLPISASTHYRRLDWLMNDDRPFELKGDHFVVAGLEERLALSIQRPVYVPGEPGLASPVAVEEPAPTLDIARKSRAAPN
jgi:two-component system chemotaxis response regulator CheY